MLFRCCAPYAFIALIMTSLPAQEDKKNYLQKGKEMGKAIKSVELSKTEIEALTPANLRGQRFDRKEASKRLNNSVYQEVELKHKKKQDISVTHLLENIENATKSQDELNQDAIIESSEKCLLENEFIPITINHTLSVKVNYQKKIKGSYRECKGHLRSRPWRKNRKEDKRDKEMELAADPIIKSFKVYMGMDMAWKFKHVDDAPQCNNYSKKKRKAKSEKLDEVDTWKMDHVELLDTGLCTHINTSYGPEECRIIEEHKVTRPYWSKTLHFQCIKQNEKGCDFLKDKECIQLSENCIKYSADQCVIWEKFFKCKTRVPRSKPETHPIFGSDETLWEINREFSQSFPEVVNTLTVFEEMKKEFQDNHVMDGRSVHLFKGDESQCSKSVASKIMYDCCGNMDGFATDVKLSKCTSDEIGLAQSKKKGLSHYIGKKKEKFLGLWESREEHVFCLFPTKLSRVFQEEARKQLHISWGDADHPNCRGLTQGEIKKLDFSKMNLLEAFEAPKQIDQTERLNQVESRLKQRIEGMLCE